MWEAMEVDWKFPAHGQREIFLSGLASPVDKKSTRAKRAVVLQVPATPAFTTQRGCRARANCCPKSAIRGVLVKLAAARRERLITELPGSRFFGQQFALARQRVAL